MNKKSFLLIIMLVVSTSIFAQQSRPVYCDVMAFNFWGFGKVNITIDLGENRYGTICDDKGKATKFNTTIDALNYMSKLGWSVKDTYFLSSDISKQKVLHFLLVKQVTDDSQISEGIYVKPKKEKEPYKFGKNGDDMY